MNLIIKLLKLRITKVILSLLMIAFILSLYFCRDWYFVQYHKCIGFYYVHKGDKAYKDKKYQKAIDNYKIALRNYPGHSRASCNLGNIYVSFENYYEAVNAYENALKYSPNFMVCRMDLGIILSEKMADYDKAIQEYGRVANTNPFTINIPFIFDNKKTTKENKGLAYYNMGLAYRGKAVYMGDKSSTAIKYLKKAKESYEKAEEYLKNNFDNTYNLALTNHLLGDYEMAKTYLVKAYELEKLPDAQNLLGLCYFELGNYEQAKSIFENMLEKVPMNVNVLLSLAKCNEKLGNNDEALKYAEKITETFVECEEAHEIIRRLS